MPPIPKPVQAHRQAHVLGTPQRGSPVPQGPTSTPSKQRPGHQPTHSALICVAAPSLVVSAEHGQLTGTGVEGFYQEGLRVLARCALSLAGQDPVPIQGRTTDAGRARFVAAANTTSVTGPDPVITVERVRAAHGSERIAVTNSSDQLLRLPVEIRLGTDLAELGEVAAGRPGAELPAAVHGSGLSWTTCGIRATAIADPAPDTSLASAGLLRWDWELAPGTSRTVVLTIAMSRTHTSARRVHGPGPASAYEPNAGPVPTGKSWPRPARRRVRPPHPWPDARAASDDVRIAPLFRTSVDDVSALLLRDPDRASGIHLAAGAPWRFAFAPAESLRAARMLLPLGTRLAAGTLHTLARVQHTGPGPDTGRLPGSLRRTGPHSVPSCTGVEATLLFPTVLAEARRWGLPMSDTEELLPTARRCLTWLLTAAGDDGYVPDPAPDGPYRGEVQARAHRAALLGADLLEAHGHDGGGELRDWAAQFRVRFRDKFWLEDRGGGRPLALIGRDGRQVPWLGSAEAELLDTGLLAGGRIAQGLLDRARTQQLARLLGGPSLDSGWGLRTLGSGEPGYNPFGHRSGAVKVQETATAVTGLAAAGYEKEAVSLLRGVIDAAEVFGRRLPEMYAAEQRTDGSVPLPHPAACRPAAVAAAGVVQLLTAVAGVRPDVPGGTVALRPLASAPLGALQLAGLTVAEQPFSVRVSRLGMGLVEEAGEGLQLNG